MKPAFLFDDPLPTFQDHRGSQPAEGDKEVQILIPQPFMGTIIGTGGTKIKDLRMVGGPPFCWASRMNEFLV